MSLLSAKTGSTGSHSTGPYRVMVVDDSAVIRGLISNALEADKDLKVVATASNGERAIEKLKTNDIEVILLDIEMPKMDGLTAVPKLLEIDPNVPIVMVSTLTTQNAEVSMKSMALGAKDYIPKPTTNREIVGGVDFKKLVVEKAKTFAAQKRSGKSRASKIAAPVPRLAKPALSKRASLLSPTAPIAKRSLPSGAPEAIAIGGSTGGPQALMKVFEGFPKSFRQPIFITQHMPPTFTTILCEHLTRASGLECKEGVDGEKITGNRIYLAPGDYHMRIVQEGSERKIRLSQDPPINFCRPAVDPMLESLIPIYGRRLLVVILTGMGTDGKRGCEAVVGSGGAVIAQDEQSSVVWGMPGAVAKAGYCSAVLPVDEIGAFLQKQMMTRAA